MALYGEETAEAEQLSRRPGGHYRNLIKAYPRANLWLNKGIWLKLYRDP